MDFIKKIWNKIKTPRGLYIALFYVFFACILSITLTLVITVPEQSVWHYICYGVSAITLTYFVYSIVYFAPKMKNGIISFMKRHKFTNTLLTNYGYRTVMFSIFTFILNIGYVAFQGVLAIKTGSAWYISITLYYLILSIMKAIVLLAKKNKVESIEKQAKTYRSCGIMFILLMLAFSGVIVLIYTSNMYFEYAGLMIYVIATYTFYNLTLSIVNIFKARKQDDLFVQSIRNINLANALISIIVLQVAMFQAFSPENNNSIANGLTGGAVSAIVLALGIFMIIKANKILKQEKVEVINFSNDKSNTDLDENNKEVQNEDLIKNNIKQEIKNGK